jgi:hypothetical protein
MKAENLHKEVSIVICTLMVEGRIMKNLGETHKAIKILYLTLRLSNTLVL